MKFDFINALEWEWSDPRRQNFITSHHYPQIAFIYKFFFIFSLINPLSISNYYDVEIKCQLDATDGFIADLIACSTCFGHHYAHHQELKSIIQWLLRVVFCAVVFQVAGLVWS